jgi:hypothetical protein
MKYTLLLLVAMVGAVCGLQVGVQIVYKVGEPSVDVVDPWTDPPCSTEEENIIYETCVVEVAKHLGVNLSRRLELRGDRELQVSYCQSCYPGVNYPRGTYCFTVCGPDRRLAVSHEHTERFLCSRGKIREAAYDCIEKKIEDKDKDFVCLGTGKKEDMAIKIFISSE